MHEFCLLKLFPRTKRVVLSLQDALRRDAPDTGTLAGVGRGELPTTTYDYP